MSASAATASARTQQETRVVPTPLALLPQLSAAVGLIVLVRDLWTLTPLDQALFSATGVGMVTYLALVCGYVVVKRVMEMPPADEAAQEEAPEAEADDAPADKERDPAAV